MAGRCFRGAGPRSLWSHFIIHNLSALCSCVLSQIFNPCLFLSGHLGPRQKMWVTLKQLDDQPKKEPAVVASWGQCLKSSEAVAPASAGFQRHHRKLLPSWWPSPNPGNGKQSLSLRFLFLFLADSVIHQMLSHVHIAWLSKPSSLSLGCQPVSASLQSVLLHTYPNLETAQLVWVWTASPRPCAKCLVDSKGLLITKFRIW